MSELSQLFHEMRKIDEDIEKKKKEYEKKIKEYEDLKTRLKVEVNAVQTKIDLLKYDIHECPYVDFYKYDAQTMKMKKLNSVGTKIVEMVHPAGFAHLDICKIKSRKGRGDGYHSLFRTNIDSSSEIMKYGRKWLVNDLLVQLPNIERTKFYIPNYSLENIFHIERLSPYSKFCWKSYKLEVIRKLKANKKKSIKIVANGFQEAWAEMRKIKEDLRRRKLDHFFVEYPDGSVQFRKLDLRKLDEPDYKVNCLGSINTGNWGYFSDPINEYQVCRGWKDLFPWR
ncbi:hypothetical protein BKH46_08075 [Helicobacter sp. 12S02634-8]|uniref:hypothetical protein n=1 Tax=Helicobacter sp. 12S02634-8 TaxID=1476199 RepID=UPI000BA69DC0|nr:hypothetical protein [Helicobacter sp. 12S02634-8]PAF46334.1 hypothetical protein BKH46_08075 [Helicobacter sp. 12S02634-8]